MLAQIPADVSQSVQLWLTLLLSGLSAAGSSALTFLIGWLILRKTEAYRQASRWEPIATNLWQERLKAYQELVTTAHTAVSTAFKPGSANDRDALSVAIDGMHKASIRLKLIMSAKIDDEYLHLWALLATTRDYDSKIRKQTSKQVMKLIGVMRTELHIEPLGEQSNEWFREISSG